RLRQLADPELGARRREAVGQAAAPVLRLRAGGIDHYPRGTLVPACTSSRSRRSLLPTTRCPGATSRSACRSGTKRSGPRSRRRLFWENHGPTQGMRQGNDVGTQYRSAIYTESDEQRAVAEATRAAFQQELAAAGYGEISTEIAAAGPFYYAEPYHQQYLAKN